MKTHTFLVGMLLVAFLFVAIAAQQTYALAILKFKVPKSVAADQTVTIVGTSMAPNSTNTNCNVQFQTNQGGYQPVTPLGPTGQNKYVNWSTTTAPLQGGQNSLEAQLLCFPAGSSTVPNLIKHLVHNVTTGVTAPAPTLPTATVSHHNSNNSATGVTTAQQPSPSPPNAPSVQQ